MFKAKHSVVNSSYTDDFEMKLRMLNMMLNYSKLPHGLSTISNLKKKGEYQLQNISNDFKNVYRMALKLSFIHFMWSNSSFKQQVAKKFRRRKTC